MAIPRRESLPLEDYQVRRKPGILDMLIRDGVGRNVGVECPRCQRTLPPLEHGDTTTCEGCGLSLQAIGAALNIREQKEELRFRLLSDYAIREAAPSQYVAGHTVLNATGLKCPRCEHVLPMPDHGGPPTNCKCGLSMEVRGNSLRTWKGGPWLLPAASTAGEARQASRSIAPSVHDI